MSGGRTIYRRRSRGRRVAAVAALVVALGAVAAAATWWLIGQTGPAARDAANGFLAAWSRGDDRGAAALTDRPDRPPRALAANRAGLDGATLQARLLDVTERDDTARARTELAWEVPGIGRFAYESTLTLRQADDRWTVTWSPARGASRARRGPAARHDPLAGDAREHPRPRRRGHRPQPHRLPRRTRARQGRRHRRVHAGAGRRGRHRRRAPRPGASAAPVRSSSWRPSPCAKPTTTP